MHTPLVKYILPNAEVMLLHVLVSLEMIVFIAAPNIVWLEM